MSANSTIISTRYDQNAGILSKKIITLVQLIYGFPTICLMGYIFAHLATSSKYKNSFYRLVQVDFLINMICWFNTWISIRSMHSEVGYKFMFWLMNIFPQSWIISGFLVLCFFHMQFLSAASLSIHRLSSILFFQKYERFWSRYYLPIFLLFVIYSVSQPRLTPNIDLEIIDGALFLVKNTENWANFSNRYFVFASCYITVLIGLGITVARLAFKKLEGTVSANQGISRKLTKIALTNGFVYSGIMAYTLANILGPRIPFLPTVLLEYAANMLTTASDLMTLSLPYILLIFDTNIRRDMRLTREIPSVNPTGPAIS